MLMKEILCFGDSNTWGWNPKTQERYPKKERWTGILQERLGDEYQVIEEGLCGRTTVCDDPIEGFKSGKKYLIPCLETNKPLDLVIIMLGTNDLKKRFSLSAFDIALGAGVLVDITMRSSTGRMEKAPQVLLVAPTPLGRIFEWPEMFEGGLEKSKLFFKHFRDIAVNYGCEFFDAGKVIQSSLVDGVHLDPEAHRALGEALAALVKSFSPAEQEGGSL